MGRFLRTETNSSGGHSVLRDPVVIGAATPGARGPGIRLADSWAQPNQQVRRQAKPFYTRPTIQPVMPPMGGTLIQYVQPPRQARVVKSELKLTQVTAVTFAAAPIKVTLVRTRPQPTDASVFKPIVVAGVRNPQGGVGIQLAPSFRGKAKPRLSAPAVVTTTTQVFFGPKVVLADQIIRLTRKKAKSRLWRVPAAFQPIDFGVRITLAPAPRQDRKNGYDLAGPIVVDPNDIYPQGPGVQLAPQRRGQPKSELRGPVVVTTVTQNFYGPKVTLARIPRPRRTAARLLAVPAAFRPIGFSIRTTLVRIRPVPVRPRLRPPVVIDLTPQTYYLATTLVRIRPVAVHPVLRRPIDLVDRDDLGYVRVHLAPQKRGQPKSILRKPTVIDLTPQTYYITTTLVRIRPVAVHSALRKPTDLVDAADLGYVRIHLAPQKRGAPRSFLHAPVVIDLSPQVYYLALTLAPSFRGKPKPRLTPPAVVTTAVVAVYYGPKVTLARIKPVRVYPRLLPVPAAFQPVGFVSITLAPSFRGKPKSRLSLTAIIDLRPQTYYVATTLVRIRPVPTRVELRPPTDLVDTQDLGSVAITLAPQKRGQPKSILLKPTVIDLSPQTYYISTTFVRIRPVAVHSILRKPTDLVDQQDLGRVRVTLAPQKRGVPHSILRKPVVIDLRPQTYFVSVTLVRITPPPVRSALFPPTDLSDAQDLGSIAVTLAPQKRGVPKSRLDPPVVIDLSPQVYSVAVELAPSFRGIPKSILRRPTDLVDRDDLGFVRVHLAYSVRGKPRSILRKPIVIDLRPQTYYVAITLAPSRYPTPMSFLRPDSKFAPQPQADYTILIHLAPQTRGKPKSKLRPPAVVGAGIYFRGIKVKLAPSRFPKPKPRLWPVPAAFRPVGSVAITLAPSRFPRPKSVLRKPVVVQRFRIPVVSVHLVRIRPPQVHSILRPPTDLVDRQDLGFVQVHLAPSRFPAPKSSLKPPTVVNVQAAAALAVTLAPQRRGTPRSFLKPPTVIGAAIAFYGPQVTLVRIRPPRTLWVLREPTAIVTVVCYGDPMCGFDFAAEVCGSDDAATVIGSTATGTSATGADAGATVTGASAAGGSVTGDDARREGC